VQSIIVVSLVWRLFYALTTKGCWYCPLCEAEGGERKEGQLGFDLALRSSAGLSAAGREEWYCR